MTQKEIEKRLEFIEVYNQLNLWLKKQKFKSISSTTVLDYHYGSYNKLIGEDMYSVECYYNEVFDLTIRFMRANYEHKIMLVYINYDDAFNTILSIDEFKEVINSLMNAIKNQKDKEIKNMELILNNY